MGLSDSQSNLANALSLIGNAAADQPSSVYDLGAPGTDANGNVQNGDSGGPDMELDVRITTTVLAAGGAANITFKIAHSDNSDGSSPVVLTQTPAIPKATLVAGYKVALSRFPIGTTKRYLLVIATPDTNNITAGAYSARMVFTQRP